MDITAIKKRAQSLLEPIWVKIEPDLNPFHREAPVAYNPISAFTYLVEMGKYPPPEIMVDLMEGFLDYFESNGDKSLDEALLGIKHTKYESLSYKQEYSLRYTTFDWFVFSNEFDSLDDAAEEFLKPLDEKTDQDTFLRNYRRWKEKKKP